MVNAAVAVIAIYTAASFMAVGIVVWLAHDVIRLESRLSFKQYLSALRRSEHT